MRRSLLLSVLLLVIFILSGCGNATENQKQVNDEAISNKDTKKVVGEGQQDTISISGKIEAVQVSNVVSKVAGKVAAVHVDIGSVVKNGQVLVTLAAEDQAADIEVAEAAVESAQVEYDLALKSYERGKELLASQAISQANYEQAYEGPFKRAEVQLKSARANLKKKQITYNDMFIKAPFAGVVTAKNINAGEMAGTQNPVLTMVNLEQVVIKGTVSEDYINKLKTGQQVQIKVPAVSGKPFTGKIANIALASDPQTKAYPIKVQIANPEHLLKPGMFAEVYIDNQQEPGETPEIK